MLAVIGQIVSVFAIVLIGYFTYKTKMLPAETAGYLSKLMLQVAAPCLVIYTMGQQSLTAETRSAVMQLIIGANLFYIVFSAIVLPLVKWMRVPLEDTGIYRCMLVFTNNGFLGFGITYAIFGDKGLFYMVIFNVFTCIYVYTLGIAFITQKNGNEEKVGFIEKVTGSLRSMITPCTIAAVLGLFIFFFGIPIPGLLNDVLQPVGNMTTPLSMLVIGMQLGESRILRMLTDRKIIVTTVLRLVILPLATFFVAMPFVTDPMVLCVVTLTAAMPAATIPVVFAEEYGKNAALAAELVVVSTFFSMITLPVAAVFLTYYMGT